MIIEKENTNYWQNELIKGLTLEGITDKNFFDFMKGKIKKLPLNVDDFGWGVFPIIRQDGVLNDIRMVVPVIYNVKSLCVNIHEYVHAYEMYFDLGEIYKWHIKESEQKACEAEKRYLLTLDNRPKL